MANNYNFFEVEKKWHQKWQSNNKEKLDYTNKYYVLEMFPYPSGNLHMGHVLNYTIGDAIARYKKMQGYDVVRPMGWDAFGLPAENAAIERHLHPENWTYSNIKRMKNQFHKLGFDIDWKREIATCAPEYYKHEQKMFIDFFNSGIAYQKESLVNWDPVDQTVLANEQVIDGKGWRSGASVEKKLLKQWFFKITEYADDLLSAIDGLDWPEKIKLMQNNWIGKSSGCDISWIIKDSQKSIKVYTTRADTIFGATFIAISKDHDIAKELALQNQDIINFINSCKEDGLEIKEKKGINTNLKVKHPFYDFIAKTQNPSFPEYLDVWIANFVLIDYGTGAIFGCPAHDERDKEFAIRYNIPLIPVVNDESRMLNSYFVNGLTSEEAKTKVIEYLEDSGFGKQKINYKLRDWGVSRQRYWGCPIPVVYCNSCGLVPEKEENLPIQLPQDAQFDGHGNPLENHLTWKYCKCPKCGKDAIRETDTLDTFVESSWYFARFCDANNNARAFDKEIANSLLPVDKYIGGAEHAVMHLLYARFFTRALKKCGYLDIDEPFTNLINQGMVLHKTYKTKDGKYCYPSEILSVEGRFFHEDTKEEIIVGDAIKMSKSKKNVVDPDYAIDTYGSDAIRLFMISDSPIDKDREWSAEGVDGCSKYINRIWRSAVNIQKIHPNNKHNDMDYTTHSLYKLLHKTIKEIDFEMSHNGFNKVIAKIRTLHNAMDEVELCDANHKLITDVFSTIIKVMSIFIPHICYEVAEMLGFSVLPWPKYKEEHTLDNTVTIAIQINGKLRDSIEVPIDINESEFQALAFERYNIKKYIDNAKIKKVIFVKNKICNIVI